MIYRRALFEGAGVSNAPTGPLIALACTEWHFGNISSHCLSGASGRRGNRDHQDQHRGNRPRGSLSRRLLFAPVSANRDTGLSGTSGGRRRETLLRLGLTAQGAPCAVQASVGELRGPSAASDVAVSVRRLQTFSRATIFCKASSTASQAPRSKHSCGSSDIDRVLDYAALVFPASRSTRNTLLSPICSVLAISAGPFPAAFISSTLARGTEGLRPL